MSNEQLQTGKDGYIRIVVGQSPYKDDKRYDQEDYLFTRPAFIVSNQAATNNKKLKTLIRVLGMILGKDQVKKYINYYNSTTDGARKIVDDLTSKGIYLANIKDDKEEIISYIEKITKEEGQNTKIKLLLLGPKAIDALNKYSENKNIEVYTYLHPSPIITDLAFKEFVPDKIFDYKFREYSTPKEIKKNFTIKELNVEPSVPYTENNTQTDIES